MGLGPNPSKPISFRITEPKMLRNAFGRSLLLIEMRRDVLASQVNDPQVHIDSGDIPGSHPLGPRDRHLRVRVRFEHRRSRRSEIAKRPQFRPVNRLEGAW